MKTVEYYQVYAECDDMTFIMREIIDSKKGTKKIKVVGFYFGEPTLENMEINKNKSSAVVLNKN